MNYIDYEEKMEKLYDISSYSFKEEQDVFTKFLESVILIDDNLSANYREELLEAIKEVYARPDTLDEDTEHNRVIYWKKHDEFQVIDKRVSAYYRIIVTLFYNISIKDDPASPFTPFSLYLYLLNNLDEEYPKQFYEFMKDNHAKH